MFPSVSLQCARNLFFAFPKRVEADFLDLSDAETAALLEVFLAIGRDGLGNRLGNQQRARSKQLFGELGRVDAGNGLQPREDFNVAFRRRGRGEI